MKQVFPRFLQLSLLLVWLAGCSENTSRQFAGIEGTGDRVASGAVTGFGSIWVNGIRFDTDHAEILIGDLVVDEEDLQPGQVVDVEGEITGESSGRADRIRYEPLLRGPIAEVSLLTVNRKQLNLLGQVVIVAEDAVFSGLRFTDLQIGTLVEISGLQTKDFILATHIAHALADQTALTQGQMTQIDRQNSRLALGELWVDFAAADFVDSTPANIALDQYLRVTGTMPEAGGDLVATRIALIQPLANTPRGIVALEGLVEGVDDNGFYLQGTRIASDSAQWFRGTPEDLAEGVRLSLTGTMLDGVLHASRITMLPAGTSRLRGRVEFIDPNTRTVQVLGNRFAGDSLTGYRDTSAMHNHYFSLGDLRIGDFVEIHGSTLGSNWAATRIERLDDPGEVILKGPITTVLSDTEIRVMGVTVNISSAEIYKPEDLAPGRLVTVFGMQSGDDLVIATRVLVHDHFDCKFPGSFNCGPPRPKGYPDPRLFPPSHEFSKGSKPKPPTR